jgi:hypothetical protein
MSPPVLAEVPHITEVFIFLLFHCDSLIDLLRFIHYIIQDNRDTERQWSMTIKNNVLLSEWDSITRNQVIRTIKHKYYHKCALMRNRIVN